jgi:hypothetical protein
VTMIDNEPTGSGYFAQLFTPGTTLNFLLQSTTNVGAGGVYDLFTFGTTDAGRGGNVVKLTVGSPGRAGAGTVPEPATSLPAGLILGGAWSRRRWLAAGRTARAPLPPPYFHSCGISPAGVCCVIS